MTDTYYYSQTDMGVFHTHACFCVCAGMCGCAYLLTLVNIRVQTCGNTYVPHEIDMPVFVCEREGRATFMKANVSWFSQRSGWGRIII